MYGETYENGLITGTKLYFNLEKDCDTKDFLDSDMYKIFLSYKPYVNYDRTFCNCLALKKNLINNKLSKYFHLKFNNNFNFEEKDDIFNINYNNFKKGLSVENNDIKRYFYIDSKKEIDKILKELEIDEKSENIKYIEFTSNPTKGILIYKDNEDELIINSIILNCPTYITNQVNFFEKEFNIKPCLFGKYYKLKKYTLYWDLTFNNFNMKSKLFKYIIKK